MDKYTVEQCLTLKENQVFDRKSVLINAKELSSCMLGMANNDGGTIVIGISNKKIEGINEYPHKLNDILQVNIDFCKPSLQLNYYYLDCINNNNKKDRILAIYIEPSDKIHVNQKDEVYFRIGDETRKLNFEDRLKLVYDKGQRYFESEIVNDATLEDIDFTKLGEYRKHIHYTKPEKELLCNGLGLAILKDDVYKIKAAAILLFGKKTNYFFPRARIRILKFEGTEEKTGINMNIIKDVIFEGTILEQLQKAMDFMQTQIKEYTKLGYDGRFKTIPEYPEFVWKEALVNAITHRDYSIKGTDIQIKIFDDKISFESPGNLPTMVKLKNIRTTHFSRNPIICKVLKDYEFVKEIGEGIDRMFLEMENFGLQDPEYSNGTFMVIAKIKNNEAQNDTDEAQSDTDEAQNDTDETQNDTDETQSDTDETQNDIDEVNVDIEEKIIEILENEPKITAQELAIRLYKSKSTIIRALNKLKLNRKIKRVGNNKTGFWDVLY